MKGVILRFAKWGGAALAALLVLGVIAQVFDPEGMKKARERVKERQAEASAGAGDSDRVFTHGYTTGFNMAKGGAVKPSSAEVDALARRAASALGDEGGLGFTMQWKDAFWIGWNKGD